MHKTLREKIEDAKQEYIRNVTVYGFSSGEAEKSYSDLNDLIDEYKRATQLRPVVTSKMYRCTKCGYMRMIETNHRGPTYSWGRYSTCKKCPPHAKYPEFGGGTTWEYVCDVDPAALATQQRGTTAQIHRTDGGVRGARTERMESAVANRIEVNMEKDSSFVADAKRAHLKKYRRNMGHYQRSLRESGEKVEKGYGYSIIHSEGRGFTPFGDAFLRLGGGLGVEGCRHVRPKPGQP